MRRLATEAMCGGDAAATPSSSSKGFDGRCGRDSLRYQYAIFFKKIICDPQNIGSGPHFRFFVIDSSHLFTIGSELMDSL